MPTRARSGSARNAGDSDSAKQERGPAAAGYSGTPLLKKLGVRDGAVFAVINGAKGDEALWADLPPGATLRRDLRQRPDLAVFFFTRLGDYTASLPKIVSVLGQGGGAWVAWPKKASGVASDLNENLIRDHALAAGVVDIKVCAIDATWSGLRLAKRRR